MCDEGARRRAGRGKERFPPESLQPPKEVDLT